MTALIRVNGDADAGELAHLVVDKIVADFRRPAYRAGFGAALLTTAIFARMGARPGVVIFTALMVGAAVERLYGMAEDIHETSLAQRDYLRALADKAAGDAAGKV